MALFQTFSIAFRGNNNLSTTFIYFPNPTPVRVIIYALQWHLLMTLSTSSSSSLQFGPDLSQGRIYFLFWPGLSEKPITTIKHIYTTMHNKRERAMNCIVAIFLYGFMRFGIEFVARVAGESRYWANKSIYFNYNYRLECSAQAPVYSLQLAASSCFIAQGIMCFFPLVERAWPTAHYFCGSTRPVLVIEA